MGENLGGGILEEESWAKNLGGGILEEEPWGRNLGGGILEEESWSPGSLLDGKHLRGLWEASRSLGCLGSSWGLRGSFSIVFYSV